ncbi:MAG: class I SAM-dependent methyltransferase [Acidobacteriota bacterium]
MVTASAVRLRVKEALRWEEGTPRGWRRHLRAFFMRDVDAALRYGPAIPLARRARSVLEVGSGPAGIVPLAGRRVIGVDLSFAGPRHELLRPVRATGARLPFADATFDLVLCFDVLEHVHPGERAAVAAELARVGSGALVIAVPYGPDALAADRDARRLHVEVTGEDHRWLSEHEEHGTFDAAGLHALCAAVGRPRVAVLHYGPIWLWRLLRREEILLRPHLSILRRLLLPIAIGQLWRLPGRRTYRALVQFDLARDASR